MSLLTLNNEGRLCLKGTSGTEEIQYRPAIQDVLLLIDTSGSMSGEKITQAKQGALDFAQSVNVQGCATALAIFADKAAMVCDATVDANLFERKISGLRVGLVGGGTNLMTGLKLAEKFERLNAVVIVTDGQTGCPQDALMVADRLKARGIEILCIGTDDADRDFLAQLASRDDLSLHVDAADLRTSMSQASGLLLGAGL